MWPLFVVEAAVERELHLCVSQVVEHFDVQEFGPQARDEALGVPVLLVCPIGENVLGVVLLAG